MSNRNNVPAPALSKLLELSAAAEHLSERVINLETGIATARQRLTGGFSKDAEYVDTRHALEKMVDDLPVLKRKCRAAELLCERCTAFLDELPEGTTLEPVEVKTDDHDLESVRAKIKTVEDELAQLHGLPTASSDIRQKVEDYVRSLARPTITGIGKNEKMRVLWPGAGFEMSGPREYKAEVLPLIAMLFPDVMKDALLREVERMTNTVVPIRERASRITTLEAELFELAYIEEALVTAALRMAKTRKDRPTPCLKQCCRSESLRRRRVRARPEPCALLPWC
jgi:hypothetical protein